MEVDKKSGLVLPKSAKEKGVMPSNSEMDWLTTSQIVPKNGSWWRVYLKLVRVDTKDGGRAWRVDEYTTPVIAWDSYIDKSRKKEDPPPVEEQYLQVKTPKYNAVFGVLANTFRQMIKEQIAQEHAQQVKLAQLVGEAKAEAVNTEENQ